MSERGGRFLDRFVRLAALAGVTAGVGCCSATALAFGSEVPDCDQRMLPGNNVSLSRSMADGPHYGHVVTNPNEEADQVWLSEEWGPFRRGCVSVDDPYNEKYHAIDVSVGPVTFGDSTMVGQGTFLKVGSLLLLNRKDGTWLFRTFDYDFDISKNGVEVENNNSEE